MLPLTTPSSAPLHNLPPLPVLPIPYVPGPVGRCLHSFWQNWGAIHADEWGHLHPLDGYFLLLESEPPLTSDPPCLSYSATHPLFQDMTWQIVDKRAIEEIPHSSPGFHS